LCRKDSAGGGVGLEQKQERKMQNVEYTDHPSSLSATTRQADHEPGITSITSVIPGRAKAMTRNPAILAAAKLCPRHNEDGWHPHNKGHCFNAEDVTPLA